MSAKKDYVGTTVGQWEILEEDGRDPKCYSQLYKARCIRCGFIKTKATIAKLQRDIPCTKHVIEPWGKNKRLKNTYRNMMARCYRKSAPNYENYGGRGITICDEWLYDRDAFIKWSLSHGYANNLTIDRIDNDKGYSPDNCRWVTLEENNRNKPSIPKVIVDGVEMTLPEISERYLGNSTKLSDYRKYHGHEETMKLVKELISGKRKDMPYNNKRLITVDGMTKSLLDWDRYLGTTDTWFISNWAKKKYRTDDMVADKIREVMANNGNVNHRLPKQYFNIHGHICSANDIINITDEFKYSRSILKRVKKYGHKRTERYLNKIIPKDTFIPTDIVIGFDGHDVNGDLVIEFD